MHLKLNQALCNGSFRLVSAVLVLFIIFVALRLVELVNRNLVPIWWRISVCIESDRTVHSVELDCMLLGNFIKV